MGERRQATQVDPDPPVDMAAVLEAATTVEQHLQKQAALLRATQVLVDVPQMARDLATVLATLQQRKAALEAQIATLERGVDEKQAVHDQSLARFDKEVAEQEERLRGLHALAQARQAAIDAAETELTAKKAAIQALDDALVKGKM